MIQPRDFPRVGPCTQTFPLPSRLGSLVSPDTVAHFLLPPLLLLTLFSFPPPSWLLPGWRRSAARTETRRRASWSPSSRCCSARSLWLARLSASSSRFCNSCPSAKDTGGSDSTRCRGPRLPRGYCSSSVCVTFWDVQVKIGLYVTRSG